jgi:hypothetical protein
MAIEVVIIGGREREREIGKGRKVERKVMWLEIWLVM